MIDLSIIIVSYNTKKLLEDCLKSVYQNTHSISYEIIVVDNSSQDGTVEMVENSFPYIKLIKNKTNVGFVKANNQGIRISNGKYILLLNPDTLVLDPALDKMVEFMNMHDDVGISGCRLYWDKKKTLQRTCSTFPTLKTAIFEYTILKFLFPNNSILKKHWMEEWKRDTICEVDTVSGACMIIRHELLNEVGLLDEKIFMYFEEVDLCYRAKQNDWKVYFTPTAEIIHYSGQSSKFNIESSRIFKESMLYFYNKHYGLTFYFMLKGILLVNSLLIKVGTKILKSIDKYRVERRAMSMDSIKEKYEEFHKNAGIQTKVVDTKNFTYHIVLSFIDKYLQPDMKVFDIGCGVGTISLYVANKGNEVLGTDISEKAVSVAQKSAELLGIKNVSFKAMDFLDAELQGRFDLIIINGVLEHLVDDRKALKKIHRLLNHKGFLYLMVPSIKSPLHRLRMAIFKRDSFDISVGHLHRYSQADLILMLEESGFSIVEIKGSEGQLREFLFLTSFGNRLLPYAALPSVRDIITMLDNLMVKTIGASAINIIAKKMSY